MLCGLRNSIVVKPDPENIGIAVGILLLSCIEAEIYLCRFYFQLMAAIFDFQHTRTSDIIPISLSVLPDPENVGLPSRSRSYHV